MRALAGIGAPVRFASNQARIRLPRDPMRGWTLAAAVVARIAEALGPAAVAGEPAAGAAPA